MINQERLSSHLDALETYLSELRSFREISREEFFREPAIHHLAERYLLLACQSVLDITRLVIASQGYRRASSDRGAVEVLKAEGLIDTDLSQRLARWMVFRNDLEHVYMDIDHGRYYDAIQQDLGDLESFASSMARLLEP